MAFEADTQTCIEDNNGMPNRHDDAVDGGGATWISSPYYSGDGPAEAVYVMIQRKETKRRKDKGQKGGKGGERRGTNEN